MRTLGKGAWGKVVKAKNAQTGTIKAIKIQKIDNSPDSKELVADIKREASVGAQAEFTRKLVFTESSDNPGEQKAYMVNEFFAGKDLSKVIEKGKYTTQEFLIIMRGMFQEMYRLQSLGIIHGDIKPANFIVGKDLTVRAVDYGFSALEGADDLVSRGTPLYSPLELFVGAPVSQVADIYSVGIAALEGLGQVKREKLNIAEHESNIIRLMPNADLEKNLAKNRPDLSAKQVKFLVEIIKKMTKQSPTQRLKPYEFKKMLDTYDKEILKIPPVPQVVKNVSKLVDDVIKMLEDRTTEAKPEEKKALRRSLGKKDIDFTAEQLKKPKCLYALKAKIAQASDKDREDFNFARQIMGDLRHITKHRLNGNKFTSNARVAVGDFFGRLVNRVLPIDPWTNLSVSGSVAAVRDEVEKRMQNNFR
ncbi:protein kinase domain-containing protein [Legionella hackeliae]|nr:protein kinase [Legionella hackeliae]